jgi:acyl-CoA thioester hydrolase/thioesterase-3
MPMEEFIQHGFGWYVRTAHLEYKRPLGLGDWFIVRTWVAEMLKQGVLVHFEILRKKTGKLCCDGYFSYTMIHLKTGRAADVPDWIAAKYSV